MILGDMEVGSALFLCEDSKPASGIKGTVQERAFEDEGVLGSESMAKDKARR